MSKKKDDPKPGSSKPDDDNAYADVGYKRPPTSHRFKPGKSGNPKGRPRRITDNSRVGLAILRSVVLAEANRKILTRSNGKLEEIPVITAAIRQMANAAAKGEGKAPTTFTSLVAQVERDEAANTLTAFTNAHADREEKLAILRQYRNAGLPEPQYIPHPEDISLNYRTGEILINGPFDPKEHEEWRKLFERREQAAKEIKRLEKQARQNGADLTKIAEEIRSNQAIVDHVTFNFPDEETRRKPDFNIREWRSKMKIAWKIVKKYRKEVKESAPAKVD